MTDETESERKARAERLRKRIGNLTHGARDDADKPTPKPESAADFVHRRMREIDQEKKRGTDP
jgi:hypothetical protein